MRKFTSGNSTFYYPEEKVNLIDTEELKIIVENPVGYVVGDLVRMFYTFDVSNIQVGVNTFEMFSPLVQVGSRRRAIFYLPMPAELADDGANVIGSKQTYYVIKPKGSTDFKNDSNFLNQKSSFIYLTNSDPYARSHPIPVFFFSERGAGLFENKILNRQALVADTNFSSVAIQYKFNPYLEIGGRNLIRYSDFSQESNINQWTLVGTARSAEPINFGGFHLSVLKISNYEIGDKARLRTGSYIPLVRGTTYTISYYGVASGWFNDAFDDGYYKTPDSGYIKLPTPSKTLVGEDIYNGSNRRIYKYTSQFTFDEATSESAFFLLGGHTDSGTGGPHWFMIGEIKLEKGNKATPWTPAPEDYEITEVVSGADLAGGKTEFNSSYAFKLLDDSEWVTKKLVCPENYIQLFWGEPRSATRFSFWFKIKEIEKSSEAWGEVEHYRELRAGTDVKERRKDVTRYRFPKTKLKLTSGVFRKDIIDRLKGIAHSPTIYKYNPYTKLNEERGVIAQVTELRNWHAGGNPTTQIEAGHFKLDYGNNRSSTIEELVNSPESVFDLEFSFKGQLGNVFFIQNRDDLSNYDIITYSITSSDFTKKTFSGSIVIDRTKKVKPTIRFSASQTGAEAEIKGIYIKGSLGGVEDVEVEIATMNIIPHQDGESEMELTVISDDFRKPDYLYF